MSAVLFGSISTVADTSELQREAFNKAFEQHGLDWNWDRDTYLAMLDKSGGQTRIAEYAASTGQSVDAAAVHATKSEIFQQSAGNAGLTPRPGVAEVIRTAKESGLKVGLVTTTSRENIDALMGALAPTISASDFDVVVDASSVDQAKPDAAAYVWAVQQLDEQKDGCVAIEDNVDGVTSAQAAGIPCVAFPNQNTAQHDFSDAERRVDRLDLDELRQLIHAAQA